ncbi:unnamed protein product [Toxocara canis]|uniref:YTH domain-containing protein n=1 Tax=Toxocara canis TaxID=6265 RepID=A0A183TWG8_TOXCA|nr:unnamed protein product [Toxocara canis]
MGGSPPYNGLRFQTRGPPSGFATNQQQFSPASPFTPNFGTPSNMRGAFDFNNNMVDVNNNYAQFNIGSNRFIPQGSPGIPLPPLVPPVWQTSPPNTHIGDGSTPGNAYMNGRSPQEQAVNFGAPPVHSGNVRAENDGRMMPIGRPGQMHSAYAGNPANHSEYVFGSGNVVATMERTEDGAIRILIGEGPANTLQVTYSKKKVL